MHQKLLLIFLLSTLGVVLVAHLLALHFELYFVYPWFDVPMHILGGVSVAFAFLLLPHSSFRIPVRYVRLVPVLAFVLIVGLIWELYEILIGIPLIEPNFEVDMIGDLCNDLLGGAMGYFIGNRLRSLE